VKQNKCVSKESGRKDVFFRTAESSSPPVYDPESETEERSRYSKPTNTRHTHTHTHTVPEQKHAL